MPQQLQYVAQLAMDNFYQQYKGENDFWELSDFISMVGNTVAGMYQDIYKQYYALIRQDKNPEVVCFDSGWLLSQELEVKKDNDGFLTATLTKPVMTFPYDRSSSGLQEIFIIEPFNTCQPERTSISALYQFKYLPKTNRVFFYQDMNKINFWSNIILNVKKIRVLYVPVMNDPEAPVADGIIADAITKTVSTLKQIAAGNVVDSTENQNSNKIMQTEIDKATLVK